MVASLAVVAHGIVLEFGTPELEQPSKGREVKGLSNQLAT